ncbi:MULTISPECIES: hypothetical protein [unclassified Kitasatospora]|uniref:hypothetical protein n=1 Tax=unclassified Kitasatospora TaxID=2633591 RepID=UPI003410D129
MSPLGDALVGFLHLPTVPWGPLLAAVTVSYQWVFAWDVEWSLHSTQAFEVYQGRVRYRDPRRQPVPAEATVLVTPLPSAGQPPEAYWPGHPAVRRAGRHPAEPGGLAQALIAQPG